jgi:hypothetical protein
LFAIGFSLGVRDFETEVCDIVPSKVEVAAVLEIPLPVDLLSEYAGGLIFSVISI